MEYAEKARNKIEKVLNQSEHLLWVGFNEVQKKDSWFGSALAILLGVIFSGVSLIIKFEEGAFYNVLFIIIGLFVIIMGIVPLVTNNGNSNKYAVTDERIIITKRIVKARHGRSYVKDAVVSINYDQIRSYNFDVKNAPPLEYNDEIESDLDIEELEQYYNLEFKNGIINIYDIDNCPSEKINCSNAAEAMELIKKYVDAEAVKNK